MFRPGRRHRAAPRLGGYRRDHETWHLPALNATGSQLFFRFLVSAYERVSLGIASHWPFEQWGRFLREHTTTVSMLGRLLHHAVVVVTEGESFRMREARSRGGAAPRL